MYKLSLFNRTFIPVIFFTFVIQLVCYQHINAQPGTDKELELKIRQLAAEFQGEVGIFVYNLRSGRTAALNADTVFPTASMIKIPILIGIMHKLHQGELDYHQSLVYRDSLLYAGEDVLGSFKQDEKIELGKVIMLMLTLSDNTASLWLQSLAGTGSQINTFMDSLC